MGESHGYTYPFVTVIMPIRNEVGFIGNSLDAVLRQDYPGEQMEIFVVDGMSDDGTRDILKEAVDRWQRSKGNGCPNIVLLDNTARTVPTALNVGLQHARGDVIIRVDGHCEIAPDYVRRCVHLLHQTGADNVGGLQRAVGLDWIGRTIALSTSSPFGVGDARFHYAKKPSWVDTVYLGAFRRDVFEHIGGFDEELVRNQDDEFNFRLAQSGGRIWLDPSLRSVYYCRGSLGALWRQYFEYGVYKVLLIKKRRAVPSWRHLVPVSFVLLLLGSLLLALFFQQPLLALTVAGPYALINVVSSAFAARRDWRALPLLPVAFLILHMAYGMGFLGGLWRWRGGTIRL